MQPCPWTFHCMNLVFLFCSSLSKVFCHLLLVKSDTSSVFPTPQSSLRSSSHRPCRHPSAVGLPPTPSRERNQPVESTTSLGLLSYLHLHHCWSILQAVLPPVHSALGPLCSGSCPPCPPLGFSFINYSLFLLSPISLLQWLFIFSV